MVYGQQQQYGPQQPQQQYGQPAQGPQYGAPAPGAPSMAQPDIKWSGLSKGGAFKVPVVAFIGRLVDMVYDSQSNFGLRIIEKYDQVQILESPAPWPWATIDLSIKYSDREESGWGRHVSSAKNIGLAQNASSLDEAKRDLVGKVYELRQKEEDYGEDSKTGQKFHGDVWRFVRIVGVGATGQFQPQPQPQYAQPQYAQPVPQQGVGVAPAPVAAPMPANTTPVQSQAPAGLNGQLLPTDTAPVRAKKLLHGKALNEFLGVALLDPVIKADSAFVNSIFDQSFIVGLKASNQVVLGADGKFQVVA